ncbi:MAG TPA: aldehyde dehydrogenase family protein [Abditibacteriaceae bacterium]|nr:aldehyde dehydrogenase family protein [Abditibacteriaceae bacterium]
MEVQIDGRVRDFVAQPRKMLINGEWVEAAAGKNFPAYNPATGEILGHAAQGEAGDIDRAVKAARRALESGPWSRTTPAERERLMNKLADLIEASEEEFGQLDTLNNGMPIAAARGGAPYAAAMLRYFAGWASKLEGSTIPTSLPNTDEEKYFAFTVREPVGVVGQIIPWNAPLPLAASKLGPPLAAGCTSVLKPAEQTPFSALRLGELIQEAGFPPGVVNIVPGYGETAGAALAAHPDVDKISFTGSTETGKLIVQAATGNLKRVTLEMGGKSPNIIFKDADLEAAIPGAATAIFANAGQLCTAGSRLYVEKSAFDQVVEGLAEKAKQIKVGPGLEPNSELGPLISDQQYQRVLGYLESGQSDGAQAIHGGQQLPDKGYFVEPTLLINAREEMKVMREEIFGPVVCVVPFEDPNEIVATANNTPYGLAAAVWTRDVGKAHRLAAAMKAGIVFVNCFHVYDVAVPFGGYKQSGWGREFGRAGIEEYTEVKSVYMKL